MSIIQPPPPKPIAAAPVLQITLSSTQEVPERVVLSIAMDGVPNIHLPFSEEALKAIQTLLVEATEVSPMISPAGAKVGTEWRALRCLLAVDGAVTSVLGESLFNDADVRSKILHDLGMRTEESTPGDGAGN